MTAAVAVAMAVPCATTDASASVKQASRQASKQASDQEGCCVFLLELCTCDSVSATVHGPAPMPGRQEYARVKGMLQAKPRKGEVQCGG